MGWIWMLVPDEALPLLVMGVGLALVLGLLNGRAALGLLGFLLLVPLLALFVETVLGELPPWVSLVLLAFLVLSLLRGLFALLLGSRAADTMVGSLAADLVRLVVRLLLLPLRMVRGAFRLVNQGRGR